MYTVPAHPQFGRPMYKAMDIVPDKSTPYTETAGPKESSVVPQLAEIGGPTTESIGYVGNAVCFL